MFDAKFLSLRTWAENLLLTPAYAEHVIPFAELLRTNWKALLLQHFQDGVCEITDCMMFYVCAQTRDSSTTPSCLEMNLTESCATHECFCPTGKPLAG